jgi:hypothetical protein
MSQPRARCSFWSMPAVGGEAIHQEAPTRFRGLLGELSLGTAARDVQVVSNFGSVPAATTCRYLPCSRKVASNTWILVVELGLCVHPPAAEHSGIHGCTAAQVGRRRQGTKIRETKAPLTER